MAPNLRDFPAQIQGYVSFADSDGNLVVDLIGTTNTPLPRQLRIPAELVPYLVPMALDPITFYNSTALQGRTITLAMPV